MRKSGIFAITLWASYPALALAQSDPDWARREMERMQAQQERFDAQVERQRAEQERMRSQQERDAARVARQRAEQERQTAVDSAGATYAPLSVENTDGLPRPITFDRLIAIFKVATDVCRDVSGPAFDNAISLLTDDEDALLFNYCAMYALGSGAGEQAARAKQ